MSDEGAKMKVVKDDESKSSKQQDIHDIPEIDIGQIRNYYINDDGHLVDN